MRSKHLVILVSAAAVAIAAFASSRWIRTDSPPVEHTTESNTEILEEASLAATAPEESTDSTTRLPTTAPQARVDSGKGIWGRATLGGDDSARPDGLASWSGWRTVDPDMPTTWWIELPGATEHVPVRSGAYRFEGESPIPGYVFVTSPSALGGVVRVEHPGEQSEMVLPAANPVEVLVVDGSQRPVEGASIKSFGWALAGDAPVPLARATRSDENGRAVLHPLPNESAIDASDAKGLRATWRGEHSLVEGALVLQLQATFSAGGRVLGAAPSSPCEVIVRGPSHDWREMSCSARVDNGSWGIEDIPFTEPGTYVFRLQGPDLSPVEHAVEVSSAGQHVAHDFEWTTGLELDFLAFEGDREPRAGIEVVAIWSGGSGWSRHRTVTDSEGKASLPHVPETQIWVRTYGDGYLDQRWGPLDVTANSERLILLPLERAGSIHGVVQHGGEPVSEFRITTWGRDLKLSKTYEFSDREDGSFSIDGVPLGSSFVIGRSELLAATAPVKVSLPQTESSVVIELATPITAHGRVVDARSGEPVAGAVIQNHSEARGVNMGEWGASVVTQHDGTFVDLALAPHSNQLSVFAKGFAPHYVSRSALTGPAVDLGVIPLDVLGDLTLRLQCAERHDFSSFRAAIDALPGAAPVAFDADGWATIRGVRPGVWSVAVYPPNGGRMDTDVSLVPGRDWHLDMSLGSRRRLRVSVVPEEGVTIPDDVWVAANYRQPNGETTRDIFALHDGVAETAQVLGDEVALSLVTSQGEYLGVRWVELTDAPLTEVDLRISGRSVDVIFLEANGEPAASVQTFFVEVHGGTGWELRTRTDPDGRVTLRGFPRTQVQVQVLVCADGHGGAHPLDLTGSAEEIVVHLDTSSKVRARLVERGSPARGVRTILYCQGDELSTLRATSDDDGFVEYPLVAKGSYLLRVEAASYWRSEIKLQAIPDPTPSPLEVRRVGGLRLEFRREGLPVAGLPFRLTSQEYGVSVTEWATELGVEEMDLTTSSLGQWSIDGLPNGEYTVVAELADGSRPEFRVDVAALEASEHVLSLP